MAENFMSKPKSVVPQTKKIYGKATFKGIKPKIPKAKEQAEPIENAPTLKEVEAKIEQHIDKVEAEIRQQSSVDEPMVGQCPHPSAKESLEKEVKIEAEEVDEPFTDPEDDDKFEDKIEEEMYEEVNKPEPEPEPEPEKPKTRKRTSRKKKETKQETVAAINAEPLDVEGYSDYMYDVIRPTIPEWEEEKEEIKNKMSVLNLDPNMNPKEIRELLAGLTDMHNEMQSRLEEAKVNLDNTTELIKSVEIKAAAEGSNAEERKLKALIAKENYVKEGETQSVNLTVFKQLLSERVLFYNSQISTLEYNKFLVMTFQKVCSTENKGF